METRRTQNSDAIAWARRVNGRWITHHGLSESAARYLDHLAGSAPERLAGSCVNARRLTEKAGPADDPKPWFYAGLFSLATADEVRQFLDGHPFTASTIPSAQDASGIAKPLSDAADATREKIVRIREVVRREVAGVSR